MTAALSDDHDRGRGTFVVVVEYLGTNVPALVGGSRQPLLEHAFNTATGEIAAPQFHHPRIGFPAPERGWPEPPQLARCAVCTREVAGLIDDLVGSLLERTAQDATVWVDTVGDPHSIWLNPTRPN